MAAATRLACAALLLWPCAAGECTLKKLRALLRKKRAQAWFCEGGAEGVEALESVDWAKLVFDDDSQAFRELTYKAMRPLRMPAAADALWSTHEVFYQGERKEDNGLSPSEWIADRVEPGMALAIEAMNRLPALEDARRGLMQQLGVTGGIDLYAARLPDDAGDTEAEQVGSYGWHIDSVDALIYILAGTKRVRVAGYSVGSRVAIDRVLGPRSAIFVPGGRWHHLLAFHTAGDGAQDSRGWPGSWTQVLSIGLPNANTDLLQERMEAFVAAIKDRGLTWPSSPSALAVELPPHLVGKPPMVFSEVDALDANGLAAVHRRTLRGETPWLFLLNQMGASLELRTRAAERRPALTALGLALCCAPEDVAEMTAEALLDLGADTSEVEFGAAGQAVSARTVALRRGGFRPSTLARLPEHRTAPRGNEL